MAMALSACVCASRTELTIVSLSHGITVRRTHTHTGERREGGGEEEVMMT